MKWKIISLVLALTLIGVSLYAWWPSDNESRLSESEAIRIVRGSPTGISYSDYNWHYTCKGDYWIAFGAPLNSNISPVTFLVDDRTGYLSYP